jgi:aspergillopepsin I
MVVIPIFTMPAIWLCVTFFLSLVQGRYVSSPYDLNNLKRDNVGSFAIGATRNVNVQRSGPRAKARALAKYGSGEAMAIASEKGLIGDVVAYNQSEDREWLSPVTLGTPGQEVLLDFDTGSSDL